MTLGFARGFATYKRPDLLLHNPARLLRLLANLERPVQLIIDGKALPDDRAGQDLIHEWIDFIRRQRQWDGRWGTAGSMATIPLGTLSKPTRSMTCSNGR